MPNTIHCPSCGRELRVPDELIGKKVKCPACGTTFTASTTAGEPAPPASAEPAALEGEAAAPRPPRPAEVYQEPAETYDRPLRQVSSNRSRGLAVIRAPAICLLITGIIGLLGTGFWTLNMAVADRAQAEAEIRKSQPPRNAQEKEMQDNVLNFMLGPTGMLSYMVFIVINLIIILGSIMMLVGKMRGLAYVASVLAMIDCCCCLVGIPFGIWSLIALNNPDAKAAFESSSIQP